MNLSMEALNSHYLYLQVKGLNLQVTEFANISSTLHI